MIDNGLMVEAKANFVACTAKRKVIIKKICLEEIVGFSFFETNIKIPELISISIKVKSQEEISSQDFQRPKFLQRQLLSLQKPAQHKELSTSA